MGAALRQGPRADGGCSSRVGNPAHTWRRPHCEGNAGEGLAGSESRPFLSLVEAGPQYARVHNMSVLFKAYCAHFEDDARQSALQLLLRHHKLVKAMGGSGSRM